MQENEFKLHLNIATLSNVNIIDKFYYLINSEL